MGLFLDFDGVLCDSLNECFVSSWIAFYLRYRGEQPRSIPLRSYRLFCSYRPFIRRGEDYLLLHSLIHDGVSVRSQPEFDSAVDRAGWEQMATYRALLYAVREEFVQDNLDQWLSLHRPYGGLDRLLVPIATDPEVWIVSTKRPEFIQRILAGWGITWPIERIILPVSRTKLQVIESIMSRRGMTEAVFVDDQVDHFASDPVRGLRCCLALWGFVQESVAESAEVDGIDLEGFRELLKR